MRIFGFLILFISSLFSVVYNVPEDVSTIQGAIDMSSNGDTVLVHPGTYEENINFEGKAITVASLFLTTGNENYIDQTIIDADGNGTVVTFRNNEDRSSILYGLSITGGTGELGLLSDGTFTSQRKAGGIYILKAQPTISYCHVYGNNVYPTANNASYGGGIMMYGFGDQVTTPIHFSPLIEHCKVYENVANLGAGIYMYASMNAVITHTLMKDNTATNTWVGGGLFSSWCSPFIYRCIIKGNSNPGNYAGGMFFGWGGVPVVMNCTLVNNSNSAIGVYDNVYPILFNNIFKDNTYNGQQGGDIIFAFNNNTDPSMYTTQGYNIFSYDWYDEIPDFAFNNVNLIGGDLWGLNPQFVPESEINDTYQLLPSSPVLDAGLSELTITSTDPNYEYNSITWGITTIDWELRINNDSASLSWFYSGNNHNIFLMDNMENGGLAPDMGATEFDYSSPYIATVESSLEIESDDDNVANPGEIMDLTLSFQNLSQADIMNGLIELDLDLNGVIITQGDCEFNNLYAEEQLQCDFQIVLSPYVQVGLTDFVFNISMTNIEGNDYQQQIIEQILISYNQEGFPFDDLDTRIYSAPVIADVNDDGEQDIIFANFDGEIVAVSPIGEILDGFPVITGNQIWGAPAVADLDNDGEVEIVITSKDEHLYIINGYGEVVLDYDASYWLLGTPAIGNLDDDEELEIVFGSFSSSGQLHAINMDGTDLPGFPIQIGERISVGVALADFNDDGMDDIVVGTEGEKLYLIYSNGETAENFPVVFDNKFKSAPTIVDNGQMKLILVANRDRIFYGITEYGEIIFNVEGESYDWTEPVLLNMDENLGIFLGSGDVLYGLDHDGNNLLGWPINLESNIVGSPVIVDIDSDMEPEIIIATESNIHFFNLDGTPKAYSPMNTVLGENYTSSMVIQDTDFDGDLEIIIGTNQSGLFNLDLKTEGDSENYWNMYRGNLLRNGKFETNHTLSINEGLNLPTEFNLKSVYPNPFNASTKIEYSIPNLANVIIEVLDLKGAITEILVSRTQQQGNYVINWNAEKIPSGIYFIQFKADNFKVLQKVTVIK